jgi:chromodomain-helicase-DNA-binding protein 1
MMPSPSGHMDTMPYTNGHATPLTVQVATPHSPDQPDDSDLSDTQEPAAPEPSSDIDAPGEEDDDDEAVAVESDSSADVDAEGEPDGDYDSDSPPSEQAQSSRAQSVSSQESSSRPLKRKASSDKDDYMTQNPELYGLRRSVRGASGARGSMLTSAQGRARPHRRIVSRPSHPEYIITDLYQVDSDDEDDDSDSDQPRKRQRTASRKGEPISSPFISTVLTQPPSLAPAHTSVPAYRRFRLRVGWLRQC